MKNSLKYLQFTVKILRTFLTKLIFFAISFFSYCVLCLLGHMKIKHVPKIDYGFNWIVNLVKLSKNRNKIKRKLRPYTVKHCQKKLPIQRNFYTWCLCHGAEVRVYFAVCLIYQNLNFTIIFSKLYYLPISWKFLTNFCAVVKVNDYNASKISFICYWIYFSFWFGLNIFNNLFVI